MRPVDVTKFKYRDNLASKRRHKFRFKAGLVVVSIIVAIGAIGYGLFYTPWLKITDLQIKGLSPQHEEEARTAIEKSFDRRVLGVPAYRNLFFYNSDWVMDSLSSFAYINTVGVTKDFPHTFIVKATERQLEGIWCHNPPTGECSYFDHTGVVWGKALQSSGSLLLNIDDMRVASGSASIEVDQSFLKVIQVTVPALRKQGVAVNKVVIPAGSFTEFHAMVQGGGSGAAFGRSYPIKFSLDSDIPGQLEVYRIFKTQKSFGDSFSPQYIDLRFDGRVYYK